jgi:hypothetical protein
VLGEFATKVDELPLEAKQEIKEGFIRLMSISGRHDASIKLLTQEDNELSRILSAHGWWILPRDINGPVKRELLRLGREQKAAEIDSYICSLFSQNGGARLSERIGAWFNLAYLSDRRQIILDSLEAHKAGKWTLSVPTLLPLIDGIMRRFRKSYLRPSKNPRRLVSAERFSGYYRRKQPKLFGTSFAKFLNDHMFATFDFNSELSPSSINRHAILHGEIFDYATEANSLKVILLLDTISQFMQTVERRRKTSPRRTQRHGSINSASQAQVVNSATTRFQLKWRKSMTEEEPGSTPS